jgi:hypothetical protein
MTAIKLYELANEYIEALEVLDDPDLPEQVVRDTLEALQGGLNDKGRAVAAYSLNLSAEIEALKAHEKRVAAKRKTLEAREEWLREYLKYNMEKCGISEIKSLDGTFTAKLGKGRPSVVIDDESSFPDDSPFVKWTRTVSKTDIAAALNAGEEVPGARLETKPSLRIS